MITAIVNQLQCSPQHAVAAVKRNPAIIKEFPALQQAGEILRALNVKVIPGPFFSESLTFMQEHHLLITDAVHIAAMKKEEVTHIASNDKDFSRVPGLSLWKPEPDTRDVPGS